MRELNADLLLALFLKLNIADPNNSVETHNKLAEAMNKLRELAIYEAKKKIELAQQLMKEAESSGGGYFETFGMITQILSLVSALVTFGATLAANAALQAGQQAAQKAVETALQQAMDKIKTLATDQLQQLAQKMGVQNVQNMTRDELLKEVQSKLTEQLTQISKQTAEQLTQDLAKQNLTPEQFQQQFQDQFQSRLEANLQSALPTDFANFAQVTANKIAPEFTKGFLESVRSSMSSQLQQAKSITDNSGLKTAAMVGQAGSEVAQAKAAEEAALKAAAANEARNNAARWRLIAEMAQQQIEAENEIIKMIVESKNQTVDAVIKMLNAMFASSSKLMSASMSR
jgi:hypothetical protein